MQVSDEWKYAKLQCNPMSFDIWDRPTLPQCSKEVVVLYGLHSHDVRRW